MELVGVLMVSLILQVYSAPLPGQNHHHVHHRIHVPQKIRTIYHTKIVKVPEHHYHYHEKEKIIPIETHKEEPLYPPFKEEDFGEADHHDAFYGEPTHNFLKKRATVHAKELKKRKASNKIK